MSGLRVLLGVVRVSLVVESSVVVGMVEASVELLAGLGGWTGSKGGLTGRLGGGPGCWFISAGGFEVEGGPASVFGVSFAEICPGVLGAALSLFVPAKMGCLSAQTAPTNTNRGTNNVDTRMLMSVEQKCKMRVAGLVIE